MASLQMTAKRKEKIRPKTVQKGKPAKEDEEEEEEEEDAADFDPDRLIALIRESVTSASAGSGEDQQDGGQDGVADDDDDDDDDDLLYADLEDLSDGEPEATDAAAEPTLSDAFRELDAELAGTDLAKSFVTAKEVRKLEKQAATAAAPKSEGEQEEEEEEEEEEGEEGEEDGDDQLDLDMNLVHNLLASFEAQSGQAGPVSNLLSTLGSLPKEPAAPKQKHTKK
eukprot:TRINITY_DN9880_c3_g1_i2.p1 TRINITY_DN9880_c3_g1~~TRINITY_DN9880_c3_g1_i2.p1  ORF type:complete len:225 (-),score=75.71 TRINITY_DN9880_c3_g1_i2:6-680(-)